MTITKNRSQMSLIDGSTVRISSACCGLSRLVESVGMDYFLDGERMLTTNMRESVLLILADRKGRSPITSQKKRTERRVNSSQSSKVAPLGVEPRTFGTRNRHSAN